MTISAREVNELKHAPAVEGVLPLFHQRWSPRAFEDREVPLAELKKAFEAARWAASSNNEQPWRFIVGIRGTATHEKLVASLAGFNQVWAPKAPVLILGTAKKTFSPNEAPNRFALYDLGAAAAVLTLAAASLGLTTHQMGGFDQNAAQQALGIPETYLIGSLMALGYLGEPATLGNEQMIAREVAPRSRKPLSEIVFSAWDESAKLE